MRARGDKEKVEKTKSKGSQKNYHNELRSRRVHRVERPDLPFFCLSLFSPLGTSNVYVQVGTLTSSFSPLLATHHPGAAALWSSQRA